VANGGSKHEQKDAARAEQKDLPNTTQLKRFEIYFRQSRILLHIISKKRASHFGGISLLAWICSL
jgi:hypothetical protein